MPEGSGAYFYSKLGNIGSTKAIGGFLRLYLSDVRGVGGGPKSTPNETVGFHRFVGVCDILHFPPIINQLFGRGVTDITSGEEVTLSIFGDSVDHLPLYHLRCLCEFVYLVLLVNFEAHVTYPEMLSNLARHSYAQQLFYSGGDFLDMLFDFTTSLNRLDNSLDYRDLYYPRKPPYSS